MTTDLDFLEHIEPKYEIGEQRSFKPPLPKWHDGDVRESGEDAVRARLARLCSVGLTVSVERTNGS